MKRLLPILAVIVGATFGAASGLYIKRMEFSSLALAGFRMGVPLIVLLPLMLRKGRVFGEPGHRKALWIASAVNACRMLFFILAYKLTSVGNAIVLFYLWPVFALLFDTLRPRQSFPGSPSRGFVSGHGRRGRLRPGQLGLVALSFAGVLVMNLHRLLTPGQGDQGNDFLGGLVMVLAAVLFAVTAILFKEALDRAPEVEVLYFQNALGALAFLPFLAMELGAARPLDLGLGLLYGGSVGLVGFGLFFFAMKRLPLFQYSALAYSEVPIAVLLGVVVLGEGLGPNQVVGALMVVTASFLAQRSRAATPKRPAYGCE
jgi:drug/metabolite transporter (DMT)-like permease